VNEAVEKGTRRDDNGSAPESTALLELKPNDSREVDREVSGLADDPFYAWLRGYLSSNPLTIKGFIGLSTRRPHGWATAAVEQLELETCRIDGTAHQPAQGVDFANQMTLRRSADRRVAGHVRHRVDRQRAETDAATHSRGGPRGFDAGMSGAHHDDIEFTHDAQCLTPQFTSVECLPARTPHE
jgi:hypothetical protein